MAWDAHACGLESARVWVGADAYGRGCTHVKPNKRARMEVTSDRSITIFKGLSYFVNESPTTCTPCKHPANSVSGGNKCTASVCVGALCAILLDFILAGQGVRGRTSLVLGSGLFDRVKG